MGDVHNTVRVRPLNFSNYILNFNSQILLQYNTNSTIIFKGRNISSPKSFNVYYIVNENINLIIVLCKHRVFIRT